MSWERNIGLEQFGSRLGYLFSYLLFTTILYLILLFLNKLPASWSYPQVAAVTLGITVLGLILNKLLK